MKKLLIILTFLLVFALPACAGSATGNTTSTVPSAAQSAGASASASGQGATTAEVLAQNTAARASDDDTTYDASTVVSILLNGDSISTEGEGVKVDGSKVTITAEGTYNLSGKLNDGQIIVNAKDDAIVRLILNEVDLRSSNSAPIYVMKAGRTILLLADGTQNAVSDGASYSYTDIEAEEPNAAIFSKSDLSIAGGGSLAVQGNFNDGISSKDGLVIDAGTLTVNAVDDGIRGKDYLQIDNGSITITTQGDGLKADNTEDAALGYIAIHKGTINIASGGDAIAAQTDVAIQDGQFTLTTAGGAKAYVDSAASAKGIKGTVSVTIDGGTFHIDAADDGLHSNNSVTVNNGTFFIASADDGIHADAALTINDGEIQIMQSYEGIESSVITFNDGTLRLAASDDGINIASGGDGSGAGPRQDTFANPGAASGGTNNLYINGGYIYVDANGDGIDANGGIVMTDGLVLVNGPTEQMNGPLDYDTGFLMTGGFLVAAGSAGMSMAPDESSSQASLLLNFSSTQPAGSLVHIQNSAGEDLLTFAPSKQYQSIAFSSPNLAQGEGYKVYTGGSDTGTSQDGLYSSGSYTAGTEYTTFTVSSVVTRLGSSGMGGPGRGGRGPRP